MSSWLSHLTLSSLSTTKLDADDARDPGNNESGDFLDEVAALGGARGDRRVLEVPRLLDLVAWALVGNLQDSEELARHQNVVPGLLLS